MISSPLIIMPMMKIKQKTSTIIFSLTCMLWLLTHPFSALFYYPNKWLSLDILSITMIYLTIITAFLIIISSSSFQKIFIYISSIMSLLLISFSCSSTISFYIFFESVLIPTFILITMNGSSPERLQASIYFLLYTIFGSLPLLLGFLWYKNFPFFSALTLMSPSFTPSIIFLTAFLIKLPMFFSHLWLPKAHVEAPLEGSMVLAAILLKLGGYGIIRMMPSLMKMSLTLNTTLISISMIGALFTSLNCTRQKDLKALIAYSSVAHMALVLSAIMSFKTIGLFSAILMMFAHGLTSSALFFLITILYENNHSRNILSYKGILIISPNIMFWMFMFSAANISAPPSINMISEVFIFSSLCQIDLLNSLVIFMASLATASFSVILYSNLSHNHFENPYIFPSPPSKSFLSLLAHFTPIIMLTTKPELFIA